MTPNPAEREQETTLIQHYKLQKLRSVENENLFVFPLYTNCVSTSIYMDIFVLLKVLSSLVVDKEFPSDTRQEAQVIPLKNRCLVHAC